VIKCIFFKQLSEYGFMKIGSLQLKNRVLLAPMAGIADLPYRIVMKRFGASLVCSEMISAKGLIYAGPRTRELLISSDAERPLAIQLFGNDPHDLAEAAKRTESDGDLLDLNLGCPVSKVVRGGSGSALLKDPPRVKKVLRAVRAATSRPLTIKIRSGWDHETINFLEIGRIAEDEGVDAITLHPRTRSQGFSGEAQWDHIRQLKGAVGIPIIGSGDIFEPRDAVKMVEVTGCDAVMIGRGSYGNPWLIRDVVRLLQGEAPCCSPTYRDKKLVALEHLALQVDFSGERKALLEMRKHLCWYVRGLKGAASFRASINQAPTVVAQEALLDHFFSSLKAEDEELNVS